MSKVHDIITERLIELLEDVDPNGWERPWATDAPRPTNAKSRNAYRGTNTLMLWAASHAHGYSSNMWLTFKQALDLGGHVRKGESGFPVCYLGKAKRKDADELDDDEAKTYTFLKYSTVFNLDQIEGIDEALDFDPLPESERVPNVERFIENTGADIEEGCAGACYLPSQDRIQLPDWKRFKAAPLAYTTALHELAHWTGHPSRLDREGMDADFGEHAYAAEEVIAEMAAAFVASDLQIPLEYERPATYLASWLECLKEDSRAIFRAASSAQDVADYLHDLQDEDIRATA